VDQEEGEMIEIEIAEEEIEVEEIEGQAGLHLEEATEIEIEEEETIKMTTLEREGTLEATQGKRLQETLAEDLIENLKLLP
jgi:hypothetical protein